MKLGLGPPLIEEDKSMLWSNSVWGLDPWTSLRRLQSQMSQIFEDYEGPQEHFASVNLWSNDSGITVEAAVPGLSAEDLDVQVTGNTLTISGQRKPAQLREGASYNRRERFSGSFRRAIELPYAVEVEKIDARCERGVLTLQLPRSESDKPRSVKIKS